MLAESSLLLLYSACIDPAFSLLCSAQADTSISDTLVTSLCSVSTHTGKHCNFHLPTNIHFLNDCPTVLQAVLLSVLSEQTAEQRTVNQFLTKVSLSSSDLICHNNSCQYERDIKSVQLYFLLQSLTLHFQQVTSSTDVSVRVALSGGRL